MHRRITACVVLGLVGLVGGTASGQVLQDTTPPLMVNNAAPPSVVFTESGVDFGKIGDENRVEHNFEFTNVGKGDLVIREARGSCGCTVPTLAKKTYAPGESGTLQVYFNPAHRRGTQNQTITVQTNDPKQPVIRLSVKAEVQPRTMVNPQSMSFGFVAKGLGPTMDVTVSGIQEDFDVTKAWVELTPVPDSMQDQLPDWDPAKVFTVTIGERAPKAVDGRMYQERLVQVTMAKDAPIGLLRNVRLVVEHNDGQAKRFELPILATQLGDVTMTPARLSLGRVTPDAPFEKVVIIRSSTNTPFEITKLEHLTTSGQGIEHFLEPISGSEGAAYKLTLKSDGIADQGAIRGQFRIHTNVKDEEIINYSYVGAVMPTRAANLTPMQPTTVKQPTTARQPTTATKPAGG